MCRHITLTDVVLLSFILFPWIVTLGFTGLPVKFIVVCLMTREASWRVKFQLFVFLSYRNNMLHSNCETRKTVFRKFRILTLFYFEKVAFSWMNLCLTEAPRNVSWASITDVLDMQAWHDILMGLFRASSCLRRRFIVHSTEVIM